MNRSVLVGVLLITALHAFDELVLIIGLPTIAADLGADRWYGLIIASYVLASIVGMAWAGTAMDAIGPRTVLLTASGFLLVGLGLAIVSTNTATFTLARVLQGVGGGMGWTISLGLISLLSPPEKASKAVASIDIAWIIPSLSAPLIGGYLIDTLSWRWIFAIQIPLLMISLILITPRISHLNGNKTGMASALLYRILGNAFRIAIGCGFILYIFSEPLGWLWLSLIPSLLFMMQPLNQSLPKGWWRLNSPLSAALFIACMAFFIFYGTEAYQPLYLIEVHQFTSIHAGLVVTAASITWMLGSQLTAHNVFPFRYSGTMLLGLALLLCGLLILGGVIWAQLDVRWSYFAWAVGGFGMGTAFNTARATAVQHSPTGQEGFIAGAISLCVSLGLSFATGIGGAIKNQTSLNNGSLVDAVQLIWWVSVVSLAITATALLWHHQRSIHSSLVDQRI